MLDWFEAAGLAPVKTDTLQGGELTVKLWLARRLAPGKAKAPGEALGKVKAA